MDLSPAATTVAFDSIIPPLRIPVRARVDEDPSKGEWVLAFKDEITWRRAWQSSEQKISNQCEMGARMGCSISATNTCRAPWWKRALVFMKGARHDEEEREACEEREMSSCLTASKESCLKYAQDTCEPIFKDVRIAEPHQLVGSRFVKQTLSRGWTPEMKGNMNHMRQSVAPAEPPQPGTSEDKESESDLQRSPHYRQRILASKDSSARSWDGPMWSEGVDKSESSSLGSDTPIDGWEGGLIKPKVEIPKVADALDSDDQQPTEQKKQSIWPGVKWP